MVAHAWSGEVKKHDVGDSWIGWEQESFFFSCYYSLVCDWIRFNTDR